MKHYLTLTMLLAIAVFAAACSQPAGTNNSAMNHNGMNHNSMSMNSNSMTMNANSANSSMNHSGMDHSTMDHSAMKSDPNAASAPYDLQFLDTMIAHHQGAVDMSKMVENKTQRAELKAFAAKIIADQNKEIERMKEWREKLFVGAPRAVNMEMPGMMDSMKMDMSKLDSAKDKEFDAAFVEMMIPHHHGAITMSQEALQKTQNADLKPFVQNIIKEQEAEIKQMNVWKSEWAK